MQENFLTIPIRSSAILTNSYVAATVIDNAYQYNQLVVAYKWTKGSLSSLEIKVEFALDDGTVYYQEQNVSIATGTSTLTANEYSTTGAGNGFINIPISCRYIKVSAKGTGTVTESLLELKAILHTT